MQYQISILRELMYAAAAHGASFEELCCRLQVTPEQLSDGEGMIAWHIDPARDFWTNAVQLTGNPLLGLHLGAQSTGRHFGMLGMLAKSCRTLGDAMRTISQYNNTLTHVLSYGYEVSSGHATITFEPLRLWEMHNGESARQAVDTSLSGFVSAFQSITTGKIAPEKVELKYSARSPGVYESILGAPVVFQSGRNALIMKRADMDLPLISHDQSLQGVFDVLISNKQARMTGQVSLAQQVGALLLQETGGQMPTIESVSSQLNMTPRTLQRRLAGEGTSFRGISLQFRKDLAAQLIRTGSARKQQVAGMVGYADADALRRALKATQTAG